MDFNLVALVGKNIKIKVISNEMIEGQVKQVLENYVIVESNENKYTINRHHIVYVINSNNVKELI